MIYNLRLEKGVIFSLYLYAIFAPHSIFLAEASIILGLVLSVFRIIVLRKIEGKWIWFRGNLEKPILSFCAVGFFSLLTACDRLQALNHIRSFWLFLFYFLIINNLNDRKDIIRLTTVLIISATFASVHGLYQYFFRHTIAVQAFIKNVITLAGFFLLITPLSFSLFLGEKAFNRKIIYLLTTLFLLLGLIFTLERSVWLGLVVMILTFLFIYRPSLKVIIPGIIILVLLFSFSPALRQRIKALGHFKSYAISSRFHQWQSGLEMMLDHPLTGVGPGNYEVLYKQYKFFEERKTYSHAHSNIVQIGAETGILGLSMFFWMMVAAFIAIWSRLRRHANTLVSGAKQVQDSLFFSLSLGSLAAFFAFHFAGLFEYNFGDSEVQLLLWFILGSLEKI